MINFNCFNTLSFRGTYLDLEEMEKDLGLAGIKKVDFDINDLLCYCEYLYNVINQYYSGFSRSPSEIKQMDLIKRNISTILEKTNHEFYISEENFLSIIIEKNRETVAAANIIKMKILMIY